MKLVLVILMGLPFNPTSNYQYIENDDEDIQAWRYFLDSNGKRVSESNPDAHEAWTFYIQIPGNPGACNIINTRRPYCPLTFLDECGNCLDEDCVYDLNGDGRINSQDQAILILNWGSSSRCFDRNGDGSVNSRDLVLMILSWGACP